MFFSFRSSAKGDHEGAATFFASDGCCSLSRAGEGDDAAVAAGAE
jgi:hypothetical protein